MREKVARAIAEHVHNVPVLYMDSSQDYIGGTEEAADAAIAAVLDYLLNEADEDRQQDERLGHDPTFMARVCLWLYQYKEETP